MWVDAVNTPIAFICLRSGSITMQWPDRHHVLVQETLNPCKLDTDTETRKMHAAVMRHVLRHGVLHHECMSFKRQVSEGGHSRLH